MRFAPVSKTLSNGAAITLRECRNDDVQKLISTVKSYINDTGYLLITGEKLPSIVEEETKWVQAFVANDRNFLLVAVCNDEIIGNVYVRTSQRIQLEHIAIIGIGLLKEWRNLGLGTMMLESTLDWARKTPFIEHLWLQVHADNEAGLQLYKKFGFVEEGRHPAYTKHSPGQSIDDIIMRLEVK